MYFVYPNLKLLHHGLEQKALYFCHLVKRLTVDMQAIPVFTAKIIQWRIWIMSTTKISNFIEVKMKVDLYGNWTVQERQIFPRYQRFDAE